MNNKEGTEITISEVRYIISRKSQLIALCSKTHHVEDASTWLMTRPCAMSTYSHGATWGGGVSSGWGGGRMILPARVDISSRRCARVMIYGAAPSVFGRRRARFWFAHDEGGGLNKPRRVEVSRRQLLRGGRMRTQGRMHRAAAFFCMWP